MPTELDAIVIGAGQSGPSLAVRLANAGMKVALVERRALGGTCVNDGCIPTKTLIASARVAWLVRNAASYGVCIDGEVSVDMKRVKARKDAVVQQSRTSLRAWLGGTANLTLLEGHARFESPHTVRVADELLRAEKFFIDVGARPVVPEVVRHVPYLTSTSMMDVDAVPEHLVVVGGSYIGLEFAQMYRRFGSRVTIVEHGERLAPREDAEVSTEIRRILEREGIDVRVGSDIEAASERGGRIELRTRGGTLEASHMLVAVGRRPNTDDLGLEHAGVRTDARGFIAVDDELRTSAANIWALGDVNGRGAFTHTSYNDYEIVAGNLLDGDTRRVSDRLPIYGLYIDPPLGRVGMNETEARASGKRVLVGKYPMARVGRARERGETDGFIEILVDADSELILGATILGIEADEVIHVIADVMYARAPYTVISRAVHAHPTVSELLPTALQQLTPLG
jgi:pyruvate/2-oxoglutarate dehydrogenase complex dihydrolipoamide dehydrogenase (E3) component